MEIDKRKTFQIKVRVSNVESLKAYSIRLTNIRRNTFTFKYGKIQDLLAIPLQKETIMALAQFYDPSLRCFVFQDFQLAPTLEELSKILNRRTILTKGYCRILH